MVAPLADPGGIPFGHFTLGKRLARGGMAEVFLARQRGPEGFDRRVAVKRILPHLADAADFVRMFLDEARLAARLSHPNIVHIYELGNVAGDYFIAMEYVDGIHAGQLVKLAETEAVPPELVARIGADAAGALAHAHRLTDADGRPLQLVHRDVSPQNIMVSSDGIVKLVDFGIAKAVSKAEETRPGVVKGKYAYMSPEQTTGKQLDGRSDVFSLGVVLWEILAGRTIVERGDVVEAMKVMRDGRFKSIREVAPRTPGPLADAITRALTLRKDDRPTATQLQVMLEAYIKSAPRLATPVQLAEWIQPRFPRGQLEGTADEPAQVPPRNAATAATAATPLRLARPSTDVAVVTSDPAALAVPAPGPVSMPLPLAAPASASHASLAAPTTEMVKPLPPPRRMALPPPIPRAPTVDEVPYFDMPPGVGDGTTQIRGPAMLRVRPRRTPWPAILLGLIALTVLAIIVTVLVRRTPPALPAIAPVATDARPADSGFTVEALDGGGGGAATDAAAATIVVTDGGAAADGGDGDELVMETATLEIVTRPAGARVTLPDQPARTTPAVMTGVPVGRVTFSVGKEGYATIERTVTLAAGEHRTLELALALAHQPEVRRKVGYLTARTDPYSKVTLRGRLLGETPFAGVELPVGTYTLVFKHPRHAAVSKRVTIVAGKTAKLNFKLP